MKYEINQKVLPKYTIYYKEGVINSLSDLVPFILSSAEECKKANPDIQCLNPDYCYVNYLDNEYREENIKVRYAQAVQEKGNETDTIHFEELNPVNAVCVLHKGSYSTLKKAYDFLLEYVKENNLEIIEPIRERYIDGMWNKETEEEWLTELQAPIK